MRDRRRPAERSHSNGGSALTPATNHSGMLITRK
jgi:hypothetical protein